MQIIVDNYGTFIGKTGNRFIIKTKKNVEEISADKIDQIIILKASSVSTAAIKLACENNIDIVYLDSLGKPYARIYPCKLGGTTLTRRRQAEIANTGRTLKISIPIVQSKIRNQIYLLKSLEKTRKTINFCREIQILYNCIKNLKKLDGNLSEIRNTILGVEGFSSSIYFSCLSKILPFGERQHKAKNLFNAMLNYGYGILYSEIEKACILAGLDPYLGLLHSDRYGKPSMVLDLIEIFRQPIVDRAIITIFSHKQAKEADANISGNSLVLTKKGKKKVIDAIFRRLHTKINYKGRKLSFQAIILDQCRLVSKFIREENYRYKPFCYR
ncbi:MAG: CRISPR-associated endonuclease Cas1 [Candidatus Nanoarchaeia archaeon]